MECCHCERGEAIQERPARAALDRFVAALLTMTPVSPIYNCPVLAHLGTDLNWHQVSVWCLFWLVDSRTLVGKPEEVAIRNFQ